MDSHLSKVSDLRAWLPGGDHDDGEPGDNGRCGADNTVEIWKETGSLMILSYC